jgi:hypothetical protein
VNHFKTIECHNEVFAIGKIGPQLGLRKRSAINQLENGLKVHHPIPTRQMKGQREIDINVLFPFMYSQK